MASTLKINNLDTASGSTITVPTGKVVVGTDGGTFKSPGQIIQTVHSTSATWTPRFTTSSGSYVTTGHAVTITPKYSNSLILHNYSISSHVNAVNKYIYLAVHKSAGTGAGVLMQTESATGIVNGGSGDNAQPWLMNVCTGIAETAGTTSAITYTLHCKTSGSATGYIGWSSSYSSPSQNSCGYTIMEIAQ